MPLDGCPEEIVHALRLNPLEGKKGQVAMFELLLSDAVGSRQLSKEKCFVNFGMNVNFDKPSFQSSVLYSKCLSCFKQASPEIICKGTHITSQG